MAIRYSGDVTIDVRWMAGYRLYRAKLTSPQERKPLILWARPKRSYGSSRTTPAVYDDVVRRLLRAYRAERRGASPPFETTPAGGILIRRVFHSPCPCDHL